MLVNIESPYAGNVEENIKYARRCMLDCLRRGEYPIASHLLYTQGGILDYTIPEERELGIRASFALKKLAHNTIVYVDRGISSEMEKGIALANWHDRYVEIRKLD